MLGFYHMAIIKVWLSKLDACVCLPQPKHVLTTLSSFLAQKDEQQDKLKQTKMTDKSRFHFFNTWILFPIPST